MNTVFSHIIKKRLSQQYENVATESLAFILHSSDAARTGLMKLLRGIAPALPDLRFRIQHTESSARPDMCGVDGATPRVFIENKFWAGLTDNQPVEYLRKLAAQPDPTVLLVVVPRARLETVWREFERRLRKSDLPIISRDPSAGLYRVAAINFVSADLGSSLVATPILAITSWGDALSVIEDELVGEPLLRNDLVQMRALCDAADQEASAPFSSTELTDQRTPAFVFRLKSVVKEAVERGVSKGILSVNGLRESHSWEGLGRYIRFENGTGVGAWFGTDFHLWREQGSTPLWLVFSPTSFGRALEVRQVLEPWAETKEVVSSVEGDNFVLGIPVPVGEEHEQVISSIVETLENVSDALTLLTSATIQNDMV